MKTIKPIPTNIELPVIDTNRRIGEIKVVLHWNPTPRNFFGFRHKAIDLDLGCCYKLRDQRIMMIDCLQFANQPESNPNESSRQGCYTEAPFLWHHGDRRKVSEGASETISINPEGLKEIESLTIYSFIYNGAKSWIDCNASISVLVPGSAPYNINIAPTESGKPMCAALRITVASDGKSLQISPLLTFHKGHIDLSQTYGWPFEFTQGKK